MAGTVALYFILGGIIAIVLLFLHGGDTYETLLPISLSVGALFIIYFIGKMYYTFTKSRKLLEHDKELLKKAANDVKDNLPIFKPVDTTALELTLQEQYDYLFNNYKVSSKVKEIYGVESMSLEEIFEKIDSHSVTVEDITPEVFDKGYGDRKNTFMEMLRHYVEDLKEPHSGYQIKEITKDIHDYDVSELKRHAREITHRIDVGVSGEREVAQYIREYLKDGVLLENIRIVQSEMSAESDMIYISKAAIYSIEVKNFGKSGKWSIEIGKDGQWRKVNSDGSREAMKDVGEQINHHVRILKELLQEKVPANYTESIRNLPVIPIVVIANNDVVVDNESDLTVLRKSSLVRYIEDKNEEIISEELVSDISKVIQENSQESIKYPIENIMAKAENMLLKRIFNNELESKINYWGNQVYNLKQPKALTQAREGL